LQQLLEIPLKRLVARREVLRGQLSNELLTLSLQRELPLRGGMPRKLAGALPCTEYGYLHADAAKAGSLEVATGVRPEVHAR
jgi:hypothetical protein